MYGYNKSPNRKDGLYFVFDIGATTLDAAIFNLFLRNYEEKISIFSAFVESYGTYKFIEMVNDTGHLPQFATLTPFDNFPGKFLDDPILLPVKEKFRNEVFQILKDLIIKARINYPTAHNWYNPQIPRVANNPLIKTKIFFAGGGADVELYRIAIKASCGDYVDPDVSSLYQFVDLPVPENVKKRLAVAYGLSFPHYDLGEFRKAQPFLG